MGRKKHSKNYIDIIMKDYYDGMPVRDICDKHGMVKSCFYKHKSRHESVKYVTRSKNIGKEKMSKKQIQKIIKDYKNNMTIQDICKKHKISTSYFYYIKNRHKVPNRNKNKSKTLRKKDVTDIMRKYKRGDFIKDICSEYDISISYFYLLKNKRGVKNRSNK